MKNIITELGKCGDIPYMLFNEEGTKNRPLVIIGHGFNNDKYEGTSYALQLANEGFATLCFDMAKQGERYDGFMENITCDSDIGMAIYKIIEKSNDDVTALIEHFSDDSRIDNKRIGISGISNGGMLSFYALSKNKTIKAAVPIIGTPDFTSLLVYDMEKESQEDFKDAKEKEVLQYVKGIDPYHYLLHEETRPMLIIVGAKDDDVPAEYSINFYEAVKKRYQEHSLQIELFIADEYHYVSREMIKKAISWLKEVL